MGSIQSLKKRVKMFFKSDYLSYWNEKLRASPMSASYATHKNNYDAEKYLSVVTIKKHRNALAKLRLSDHNLHIHSGRQTRPKTPRDQRFCKSCPAIIEDEVHLLFECAEDREAKDDFFQRVCMEYPEFATKNHKSLKYQFIMQIKNSELLKNLGFFINLLFKNRDKPGHDIQ